MALDKGGLDWSVENGCGYEFFFRSSAVCGAPGTQKAPQISGKYETGFSQGTKFLICLIVATLTYLIVGTCMNRRNNEEDSSICNNLPNKDFWISLPGLCSDGITFCARKVKSVISGQKGDSGYQDITY